MATPIKENFTLIRTITGLGTPTPDADWRATNDISSMVTTSGLWSLTPKRNEIGYLDMTFTLYESDNTLIVSGSSVQIDLTMIQLAEVLESSLLSRFLVDREQDQTIRSNRTGVWEEPIEGPLVVGFRVTGFSSIPAEADKAEVWARFA